MKNILLIDDDEIVNFISKNALTMAGFDRVNEAINGKDALDYLKNNDVDFIFLDINMPVMDGWEFLESIKNQGLCHQFKIAMLSSSSRSEDRKKAMNYECVVTYFEKPLSLDKIDQIKEIIND